MRREKISPEDFFWIIMLFDFVVTFIMLLKSEGTLLNGISYGESFFCDFWNHVERLLFNEKIYGTGDPDAIFPPLAYCIIMLFVNPLRYKVYAGDDITMISRSGYGTLFLVLFISVFCVMFVQLFTAYYHSRRRAYRIIAPLAILFCYPFWCYAFERGNMTLYALIFLWFALENRNNPNKLLRELAMISLAISAGIKLYPAIFGILWLKDKKYREAIRLIIYGLAAFLLPFFILGKGSVIDYFDTFKGYLGKGALYPLSIMGTTKIVFTDNYLFIGYLFEVLWVATTIAFVFLRKTDWKTIAVLMSTQTIMIPEAYLYTYVYLIVLLIIFLNEYRDNSYMNYVYAFLLSQILSPIPVFSVYWQMYANWLLLLLIIVLGESVAAIKKRVTMNADCAK